MVIYLRFFFRTNDIYSTPTPPAVGWTPPIPTGPYTHISLVLYPASWLCLVSLCSSHTGLFAVPPKHKAQSCLRTLHGLFPLLGMLFPILTWPLPHLLQVSPPQQGLPWPLGWIVTYTHTPLFIFSPSFPAVCFFGALITTFYLLTDLPSVCPCH